MAIEVKRGLDALTSVPNFFELPYADPIFKNRFATVSSGGQDFLYLIHGGGEPFRALWLTDGTQDIRAVRSSYKRLRNEFIAPVDLSTAQQIIAPGLEEPLPGTVIIVDEPPRFNMNDSADEIEASISEKAAQQRIIGIDSFMKSENTPEDFAVKPFWVLEVVTDYWNYSLTSLPESANRVMAIEGLNRQSGELARIYRQTAVLKSPLEDGGDLVQTLDELLKDYSGLAPNSLLETQ